jgi:hypothetical protein
MKTLEIESDTKPTLRLTDDGEEDMCIELNGSAFIGDTTPIFTGKVKVYFSRKVMKD